MFTASVMSAYRLKSQIEVQKVNYRQTKIRYFVVFVACLVVFGCQYCFDNPSALQTSIEHNYEESNNEVLSQSTFNLLYSLYSFPNVVVPLLGGYLIDRFGARFVLVLTASLCLLGQGIFSVGGWVNIFGVMMAGRVVFGLGGQVLHASQNTLISNWFKASELSVYFIITQLVLGICISFPKLGSSLNSYVSPSIAELYKNNDYLNVGVPLVAGLIMMFISLLLSIVLFCIDRSSDKKVKIHHEQGILSGQNIPQSRISYATVKLEQSSLITPIGSKDTKHQKTVLEHMSLKDIKELPITFWLFIFVCMLSQALFIPFLDNGNEYYQKVFIGINSASDASLYMIFPYVVSCIFVVPFGYYFDKLGHRGLVIVGSCAFYIFTYLFMMTLQTNQQLRSIQAVRYIPSIMLGICIALFCTVIVPTVPILVAPRLLGTGFGMMQMLQNLGLALFPLIAGLIRQTEEKQLAGFHLQTLFFFLISCICMSFSIFLKLSDTLKDKKLANSEQFRQNYTKTVLVNQ